MEIASAVVVEVGRCVSNFMFSKTSILLNFHRNIRALENESARLNSRKNEIEEEIRLAETEGKHPTAQVNSWIRKVEEISSEVQPLLQQVHDTPVRGCSLGRNMRSLFQRSKRALKKHEEVKQLLTDSCSFRNVVVAIDRKPQIVPVQRRSAPNLAGQEGAQDKLDELMGYLKNDSKNRIAIWGMGGIGKTTLALNLNNFLESSPLMESFDVVIWVTVTKDLELPKIQSVIAKRLNVEADAGETTEVRAMKLHHVLMSKKFILILDDVWEKLDLDILGIPRSDDPANSKIVLTTRNLDVCRGMLTDVEVKMDVLTEEAAWNLFAESAGNVVDLEHINPLARSIARKCCGLPLAIKTMGTSMRNKKLVELWENALCQLHGSAPHVRTVEEEMYVPLKLSYNSLPSKVHRRCFLYCSLFPENCSIKTTELIRYWIAVGLIDDSQSLEESFNYGVALVETLKDSCMLEAGEGVATVKMHNVVRDLAIWISKRHGFYCQAGTSLPDKQNKLQKITRISLMNKKLTRLPSQLLRCSALTVLLLQGNPLEKIPDNFFRDVRALKILNLNGTLIKSLPASLLCLSKLCALFLKDCCFLEKLPPLDLSELQLLDLSSTRLTEVPWEKGMLSNLRELNLSRTHYLETIKAGTISGLTSLEILDMSFSEYKWHRICNVGDLRASSDELLSLEQLSVLRLRLDNVDCLALSSDWLRKLRKFNIRISPRSCESNCLPTQHDEKRVILRGVDLMRKELEGLLCNATALDLAVCGGVINLSEVVVMNNLSGLPRLKSLTLSSCDYLTSLINGENIFGGILPHLEHLKFIHMKNLVTILEGVVPRGGCLRKLKTIEVVDCRRMKNLISFSLLRQLKSLEEIRVGGCRRIKRLVAGMAPNAGFQHLKVLEMWDMINLRSVCSRTIAWPALERIKVSNCPMLVKLPLSACNTLSIKEIRGELEWWNKVIWEEIEIKSSLQQRFQACTVSTTLSTEGRTEERKSSSWKTLLLREKFHTPLHWEHY